MYIFRDFFAILQLLYKTLELSKDTLMHFNLVTFKPNNIKSHYFFLTRILELLPLLTHLTITKVTPTFVLKSILIMFFFCFVFLSRLSFSQGEIGLGERGFKELVKGMAKSSGALQVI